MKNSGSPSQRFSQSEFLKARAFHAHSMVTVLLAALFSLLVTGSRVQAQLTYAVSNLFTVPVGTGNIVASGNDRGLAYDAVSNLVYVSSSGGSVGAYDGTSGSSLGTFNTSGYYGGLQQFPLDQVGVAADGIIYVMNLSLTNGQLNYIYRYPSWNSAYSISYASSALLNVTNQIGVLGGRVGDTMAVTGSGTNTLIIAGVGAKPYFALFSTVDGTNFTPTIIHIPTGFSVSVNVFGLCFYTNNTFLVKPASSGNNTAYLIQYPTNFASQTVVTGTVIASPALGGSFNNTTMLSYAPGGGLLGVLTTGGNPSPIGVLSAANLAGGTSVLVSTNAATPTSNGNATGGVAMGGQGLTNVIYAIDTANSLLAYKIYTIPPVAPTISVAPAGGTAYFTDTLSVTATGTQPYSYFWQASVNGTAAGPFANIPGANANSLTIISSTNYYQVIITNIVGSVTSAPVQVAIIQAVTNAAVAKLWTVAAGQNGYSWLSTSDNNERGIAYDTNSQRVVVAAVSGLYVLNATNGASIEQLNQTGVTFGGLLGGIDQVGIADDGAVYAGNLVNAGGNFVLNRWSNPSNSVPATNAFNADPGNGNASSERWGDTLAVRGAGPTTQMLLGSRASAPAGTNVAFLTANDSIGLTYASSIISVSNVPAGFAGYGICFGAGNTFWAKSTGGDLYEIGFETNTYTGWIIFDYKAGSQIAGSLICAGVDPVNSIFASITDADSPHDVQLFQLTGTPDSPVIFQQGFFASANGNGNGNAAITVKYPRVYAIDVNNGIVALNYGVPAATIPAITTPPASVTAYTNVGSLTLSVSASGSLPLYYQWRFNSNNITGATNGTYLITNTALPVSGNYDVVVHNLAGTVTSTPPAVVTLVAPVSSPLVTPLWSISPGTNGAYLTTSGYETRGLAFDLNTSNLFIADHFNIHLYNGITGAYSNDLNTAGIPAGGVNGWTVDQIGVADDGTLYSCNLSPDGTAFSIISYAAGNYGLNYAYGGPSGGSDLNTLDPAGDRWGDTMAIRGSGADTEILFGSYNGTSVALFTTQDGFNFTPAVINVLGDLSPGFASLGLAFGPGNTFYAKGGHNFNLRWVSFDTNANTGTVIQTNLAPTQTPNDLTGLGVDITNNVLGGVCYNDSPHDVQLYLLRGSAGAPTLFSQDFFPTANANGQENSVVTLKGGLGFALDVNNGVIAFTYGAPAPSVSLTSVSYTPSQVTITWKNAVVGHKYQIFYKNHLTDTSWTLLTTVTAASTTPVAIDSTTRTATRFYQIVSQ